MGMGLKTGMVVSRRVENQAKATANDSTKPEQKNKATLDANARLLAQIQASTFVRKDCATQVQMMQALIACGRLVVENDCSDEEYVEIANDAEEEFDTDVVFVDDDEIRDYDDSSGAYASPDGKEAPSLDANLRYYEIKVVESPTGEWSCIPPRNPLLGYRTCGFDREAESMLEAVRRQFAFYDAVSKWLQNEGGMVLKSPAAFMAGHVPMTQVGFCGKYGLFAGREGKADTSGIHGYCQSCRICWENASLPLGCVFGGIK